MATLLFDKVMVGKGNIIVYSYVLHCTKKQKAEYKKARGRYYREHNGKPLLLTTIQLRGNKATCRMSRGKIKTITIDWEG